MTPVYQTTNVNCLSAAIASVLDIPLEDAPELWTYKDGEWIDALRGWVKEHSLGFCYFDIHSRVCPLLDGMHVIVVGSTRRSTEWEHAVIAFAKSEGLETKLHYVHDPYRRGDFLVEPRYVIFFTGSMK